MKTIAVVAFKGGEAKTTTAVNISSGLAQTGADVGAFDLDRTSRTLTSFTGAIDRVQVRQTTAGRLGGIVARGAFDYAVFDCPPSLARESASSLKCADVVIVTMRPSLFSVPPLLLLMDAIEAARDPERGGNPALRVILLFTMWDERDLQMADIEATIREQITGTPGLEVWPDVVALQPEISAANNDFCSVLDSAPDCAGARTYRAIANHLSLAPAEI